MPDPSSSLAAVAPPDQHAEPRQRFSEVLNDLASRPAPAISLGDVLDAFGDRAFGALMLVFAAPNMLPPGMSAVPGAASLPKRPVDVGAPRPLDARDHLPAVDPARLLRPAQGEAEPHPAAGAHPTTVTGLSPTATISTTLEWRPARQDIPCSNSA